MLEICLRWVLTLLTLAKIFERSGRRGGQTFTRHATARHGGAPAAVSSRDDARSHHLHPTAFWESSHDWPRESATIGEEPFSATRERCPESKAARPPARPLA